MIKNTLVLLAVFAILISSSFSDNSIFTQYSLPKTNDSISQRTMELIDSSNNELLTVWVFFTDKGISDELDFAQKSSDIALTDKAKSRRERNGITEIRYEDIPVRQNYISEIEQAGGQLRRQSRWLNAASFEITPNQIIEISKLSFVFKIDPVATIASPISIEPKTPEAVPLESSTKEIIDYGGSYDELNMINVIPMHVAGHNGEGVLVGMFDSGFRKSHVAFDTLIAEGRLIAEYDFINNDGNVQNEGADVGSQHNHGTATWSTLGGYLPGTQIGPAYGASFIIAKTEDIPTETEAEEDNWIAALEWADSIGADIVSSSLSYSDWYTYEDFDGATAPITIAANAAASLGILVCNSMGNAGPSAGSLNAPADAYNMLAVGAVDASENLASFSSRGPTFDGRIKPEVCAMGVSVYLAGGTSDTYYYSSSGTSFSTPLTGGAAAVLLSANPTMSAMQLRTALMETADNAGSPDNDYGWGVIDLLAAYNWGANFTADDIIGDQPFAVQFTDSSVASASNWKWYFGDGDSAMTQNPSHTYNAEGMYNVTLTIDSDHGQLTRVKEDFITVGPWQGLRGDANNSGEINILDITYIIAYLYLGGPEPIVLKAGDANNDLAINILDVTFLIDYIYTGGPAPEE